MGPRPSPSQGCRQRAHTLPHEDDQATPSPTDSLSSNDVHSKAKCILHCVRLALRAGVGSASLGPCQHPARRPAPSARGPGQLYLGQLDGFTELVQGALEVCDLWGQWAEPLVLPCLESPPPAPNGPAWPSMTH